MWWQFLLNVISWGIAWEVTEDIRRREGQHSIGPVFMVDLKKKDKTKKGYEQIVSKLIIARYVWQC